MIRCHEIEAMQDYRLHSVEDLPMVYVVTEGCSDEVIKAFTANSNFEAKIRFTRWVANDGPMWERIAQGEREP